MPAMISKVCKHIPVICMAKRPSKVHCIIEGNAQDVTKIYSQIRKHSGRVKILANDQGEIKDGLRFMASAGTERTIPEPTTFCSIVATKRPRPAHSSSRSAKSQALL